MRAGCHPPGRAVQCRGKNFADAVNAHLDHPIDGRYIARLERGELHWPSRGTCQALRKVLSVDNDHQLGLYIFRRSGGSTPPDHAILVPALIKQRAWLDTLIDDCPNPRQQFQLLKLAAGTAGLLGYVAVGRGAFPTARAYLAEAFCLAELAGDTNLQGWVRGLQSFGDYYAGNYRDSLALAQTGLVPTSARVPQGARLAINGVARAYGKLGDERGVRSAVDTAFTILNGNGAPDKFPSSVMLGSYSTAQVASNAATAFLSLGLPTRSSHTSAKPCPRSSAPHRRGAGLWS